MDEKLTKLMWAKSTPYKNLFEHMRETAIVCKVFMTDSMYESVCLEVQNYLAINKNEAQALIVYLAGLHDIGKCHPLFQCKDTESKIYSYISQNNCLKYPYDEEHYRHELGSADAVKHIWKRRKIFDNDIIHAFSTILKLHHQGKKGKSYTLDDKIWDGGKEWIAQQEYLENLLFEQISPPNLKIGNVKQLDAACTIITAIIILADWIASNSYFEQFDDKNTNEDIKNAANRFIELSGMLHQESIKCKTFSELWENIPEDSMRPLQSALNGYLQNKTELPLLMMLEAPMGEGKTEAGLYAAFRMAEFWKKEGIYVALPTSATSNQMYGRVNQLLSQHRLTDARLMHSMAWLQENIDQMSFNDEIYADIQNWTKPSKLSLLSPYAVGTIDQALMAALKTKYGVLRLFGLAGKVLFIDEVHAYDAYMSSILKKLLEWCKVLKIPVVMLSATLPVWKKRDILEIYSNNTECIKSYQQITALYKSRNADLIQVDGCTQNKEIKIKRITLQEDDEQKVIDVLLDRMTEQGCACIIVNTIKKAQRIYNLIKSLAGETEVILFHSAFTVARREEIENYCLDVFGKKKDKRPKKCILVATQVVEQSLDLDFDFMISEIAPIDLLLQRVGRLHRHSDTLRPKNFEIPELWVLVPPEDDYGDSGFIYYNHLLDRTNRCLKSIQTIKIPEDIPELIEQVYQREEYSEEETERFMQQLFSEQLLDSTARGIELGSPMEDDFGLAGNRMELLDDGDGSWASAKTRLGEDSIRFAVLPYSVFDEVEGSLEKGKVIRHELARRVMQYSVSVSRKRFKDWISEDDKVQRLEGSGKLTGILLFRCNQKNFEPTETIILNTEHGEMYLDRDIGLQYLRRE